MDCITLNLLNHLFSPSRMAPYLKGSDTAEAVLKKYHFNITLSEAMIPALHYLEICLRNRMDQLFCGIYGAAWLINNPKDLMIFPEDIKKIQKIVARVERENHREATHGDIISQMTFGFWCSFFHRKYDPVIWHRKDSILSVFPHLQRVNRKRSHIEQRIGKIKDIRNRIAHYEPIWNGKTSMIEIHTICLDLIGAISKDALLMLKTIDRFPDVARQLSLCEAEKRSF